MVEYKKQHYVPQSYLRFFSHNGKMVYAYILNLKKSFPVNIKKICQKDYFYCDDPELEQNLGKIEQKQARVIKKVINELKLPSIGTSDLYYLHMFILLQCSRTKESEELADSLINTFFDTHLKPLMKESTDLIDKGIKPELIDSLKIKLERPHLRWMFTAMSGVDYISDLKMVLILNRTDRNFITSDVPCCLYNYIKSNHHSLLGFQSPGILFFCPLNRNVLLLLFDPNLYHLSLNEKSIIHVEKTSDIDAINKLQIHNCLESLIYSDEEDGIYLNQLHTEIENNLKTREIKSTQTSKKYAGNGEDIKIIEQWQMPIDYTLKLSFLSLNHTVNKKVKGIIRKSKKSGEAITLCRSPKICGAVDKHIENTIKRIEEEQVDVPIND